MKKTGLKYITWPVLALMAFVNVIGFDDIIYNFKNQGLGVITSWIVLFALYIIPYGLMVGQLGSTFDDEGGGLTTWVRETSGETLGYFTAWTYWVASIPYVVDTANSVVVAIGWLINGNNSMEKHMSNVLFSLLTFIIFVIFILIQSHIQHSIQVLSIIGGGAMFLMTILFVVLTGVDLLQGGAIASAPVTPSVFVPKFNLHFLSTIGLLIYATSGSELVAPYVTRMKNPKRDFPKAIMLMTFMAGFLTIFGSLSLGVFFNHYHLPVDLKMNGSFYAFQIVGEHLRLGKAMLYAFIVAQLLYMFALLALLLDAMTRILVSDTGPKYMPSKLLKVNRRGIPINGYIMTSSLCAGILLLGVFLPNMNEIFNWLLNLNGIVSPFVTCWIFFAFIRVRQKKNQFPASYVFIKNDCLAILVGGWCLAITFIAATMGVFPQDVPFGSDPYWHELTLNIITPIIMVAIGCILPLIARYEQKNKA
ncbi:APC family permease [Pediococcus argentinicus]|uniref:APC family permease n=1 Tax=Pediococcus argentinicus TaxID=480391 RepID=UPI00338DAF0D